MQSNKEKEIKSELEWLKVKIYSRDLSDKDYIMICECIDAIKNRLEEWFY